jgi:hypothetical protein
MLGAAGIHIHQIRIGQTFAPGNVGAILYFDIVAPLLVLALLAIRGNRPSVDC